MSGHYLLLTSFDVGKTLSVFVEYRVLVDIGLAWILTPISLAVLAYMIYRSFSPLLRKISNVSMINRVMATLVILAGVFTAYSLGANDVGNSTTMIHSIVGRRDYGGLS